jgi:hypothetical protein
MCLAIAQHQRKTHQEREEFDDVAHLTIRLSDAGLRRRGAMLLYLNQRS